MAFQKTLRTFVGIELPTKHGECIGIVFPNLPGCTSTAVSNRQIPRAIREVTEFHTEGCPLSVEQVERLLSFDPITDEEYKEFYFKIVEIKVWVDDAVGRD